MVKLVLDSAGGSCHAYLSPNGGSPDACPVARLGFSDMYWAWPAHVHVPRCAHSGTHTHLGRLFRCMPVDSTSWLAFLGSVLWASALSPSCHLCLRCCLRALPQSLFLALPLGAWLGFGREWGLKAHGLREIFLNSNCVQAIVCRCNPVATTFSQSVPRKRGVLPEAAGQRNTREVVQPGRPGFCSL